MARLTALHSSRELGRRDRLSQTQQREYHPPGEERFMPAPTLRECFQPKGQRRALEAYAKFAGGSAWSVPMKMDLYAASRAAFDPTATDSEAFAAFESIYGNLVSYWQVFRPHGASECWPARQIFEAIKKQFGDFAWGGSVSLPTLLSSRRHQALVFSLMEMEGIKPNNEYPVMTVSKFLHFYNPSLFPIYDTEVVWNKVFKRFKGDFNTCCTSANLDQQASGAGFLRNYMCWASAHVTSAHPEFMPVFVDWLADELPPKKFETLGRDVLSTLYATAFEFTAIGAAVAQ
jgi:hypothetical protein